jgi:tetratricopeptide (TPR) repeat protein
MARPRFVGLALALLTLLLYLPVWNHDFLVYDDPDYITQSRFVQAGITWPGLEWAATTWHASNWHPLTWFSHMTDCEFFGLEPGAHHLVSALFHCLNALLAMAVLFRLTGSLPVSAFVAALFAWHPLHIQSVAWAAERKDVLSAVFFWLTLLAYVKFTQHKGTGGSTAPVETQPRSPWKAVALVLFGFGLMSKPMLVTLPFVLLLLDYWPLGRFGEGTSVLRRGFQLVGEKLGFFALSAGSCVVTYLAQRADAVVALEPHPLDARLANAVVAYGAYLAKTFWPSELAIVYPLPKNWPLHLVLASVAVLAVVSVFAWTLRRRRPHLLVGWLWFVGMLIPVIGLVQVGGQAMADRYTYLPLTGIFLALAMEAKLVVARLKLGVPLPLMVGVVALGALALTTRAELRYWRDSESLFTRALAVTTNNAIAHANLGVLYGQEARRDEAMRHYQEALRIDRSLSQAHNNIANLLDEAGKSDQALEHYVQAVRLKPRNAMAHANLGTLLSRLGRHAEATKELSDAVQLGQGDSRPSYLYGKALLRAGRSMEATVRFRNALKIDPNDVQSLVWLARVLAADESAAVRDGPLAVRLAEQANALTGGSHPTVLDSLAIAYAETGRYAEARQAELKAMETAAAAKRQEDLEEFRRRLKLFEAGQPHRENFAKTVK